VVEIVEVAEVVEAVEGWVLPQLVQQLQVLEQRAPVQPLERPQTQVWAQALLWAQLWAQLWALLA